MAAKQGITVTKTATNPKAKYQVNYIRYRIYNKDGTYKYGVKKYITRKTDEGTNKEN